MNLNRAVNKANTHRIAASVYCPQTRSLQPVESLFEQFICQALIFNSKVKRFVTQPCTFMNVTGESGWRQYTPDLLLETRRQNYFYGEIKPLKIALRQDFQKKFEQHKRIVKDQSGKKLLLFTEKNLLPAQVKQFEQLKAYLRVSLAPATAQLILDQMPDEPVPLAHVERLVLAHDMPSTYSMSLIAHQKLRTLRPEIITRQSLVEVAA